MTTTDTRECPRCKLSKSQDQFETSSGPCISCKKEMAREKRLQQLFFISQAEYDQILSLQGGCAICGKQPKPGKHHSVDHDHGTGLIRGALCNTCNRAIAKFHDNPDLLESAARYLRDPPATKALGAPRYGLRGRVSNKAATRRKLNKDRLPPKA